MFNQSLKKRVLFVGIPDMALICLDGLQSAGVNIVGVVGPKKNHATYDSFKDFVEQRNLNFIEYDRLDDKSFIEKIKNLNADIAVVCSFNYKIPKVLLDAVKGGFINVHPSLLPKYRGPNPYSITIMNKETESGVTLHFMDEHFDTGDIIIQYKIPVSPIETMGLLFNRTNILACKMLIDVLRTYEQQELPRIKQPEGVYEESISLKGNDLFINYEKSAEEIESFIRALNPFLLAKTTFRSTVITILSAEFVQQKLPPDIKKGSIVKIENDKFYIATGKGLLAPTSMQFGSYFAGTAKEFIKILNPKIGEPFGGENFS